MRPAKNVNKMNKNRPRKHMEVDINDVNNLFGREKSGRMKKRPNVV